MSVAERLEDSLMQFQHFQFCGQTSHKKNSNKMTNSSAVQFSSLLSRRAYLCFFPRVALDRAAVLLSMKREMVRLDNVWGVGGGQRPVKHLIKEVSWCPK